MTITLLSLIVLQQVSTVPIEPDYKFFAGLMLGLLPFIIDYAKSKMRWKAENGMIQSQTKLYQSEIGENIAQAASLLLDQSYKLNDKNNQLVDSYERVIERQEKMYQDERIARLTQEEKMQLQIEELKAQIHQITSDMKECSREIISIVLAMQNGGDIDKNKLQDLEQKWRSTV